MSFGFTRDPYSLPEKDLNGIEKLRLLGAAVVLSLAVTGVLVLRGAPVTAVSLSAGDISPRDVTAPRGVNYTSEVLTERARQAAEGAVGVIYDAPDAGVARRQVSLARQVLDRITSIRGDADLSPEARAQALQAIEEVSLSDRAVEIILGLPEEEWLPVEQEVVRVLDLSMRMVIRDLDVSDARRRVPALLSFDLSDDQSDVVVDLVGDLVVPNTLANEERTNEARRRAREAVQPISVTYQAGQAVIRAGDRVTELQTEALRHIGLLEPERRWTEDLATLGAMLLISLLLYLYIVVQEPGLGRDWRRLGLVAAGSLLAAVAARLMIPDHVLLPYAYPAAALPMLAAVLVSPGLALVLSLLPAALYANLASGALLELAAYGLVGSLLGVLVLGRLRHLKTFIWGGAAVVGGNALILALFRLPGGNYDVVGMASLLGAAAVSGALAAGLAIMGYMLISGFMGAVTSLQLLELSRPTRPILRELMLKAPGTYHHSIMVANLAEQAAERIGANALLARVGAYYHDVGKIARPYFFSENQSDGDNVHERLDPRASAQIILGHVPEGVQTMRRQRMPEALERFVSEHHGRMCQDYFYQESLKRQGDETVDRADFCYSGPRPQSKETGIVMLADACEAAVRATRPASVPDLAHLVERIVDDRILEGELDECPLTLHDIAAIKMSFVNVLQGVFHPRVQYPEGSLIEQRPGNAPRPTEAPESEAISDNGGDGKTPTSESDLEAEPGLPAISEEERLGPEGESDD